MKIGVPKERCPTEKRVALVPSYAGRLHQAGHQVSVERSAGMSAGYSDEQYIESGAVIAADRAEVFAQAEMIFMLCTPYADPSDGVADLDIFKKGQALIAFLNPLMHTYLAKALARKGVSAFALELIPRISRAQSMDALSSMASLAGYKGALLAANYLPKIFPLMMTAAGSLMPARVFVVGAGVSGLQACATAKRMGALVSAYDIRSAVKEQVKSVGAEFVEFDLPTKAAEDARGYATSQGEDFIKRQQIEMTKAVAASDVVITTAGVPGKRAPKLITRKMVEAMAPGSVLVDIVAELGGNCELTRPGDVVVHKGVTILGPLNLPSTVAYHASQMLSKNITTLFEHLTDAEGNLNLDLKEEITLNTLLCHAGDIVSPRVREVLETV